MKQANILSHTSPFFLLLSLSSSSPALEYLQVIIPYIYYSLNTYSNFTKIQVKINYNSEATEGRELKSNTALPQVLVGEAGYDLIEFQALPTTTTSLTVLQL